MCLSYHRLLFTGAWQTPAALLPHLCPCPSLCSCGTCARSRLCCWVHSSMYHPMPCGCVCSLPRASQSHHSWWENAEDDCPLCPWWDDLASLLPVCTPPPQPHRFSRAFYSVLLVLELVPAPFTTIPDWVGADPSAMEALLAGGAAIHAAFWRLPPSLADATSFLYDRKGLSFLQMVCECLCCMRGVACGVVRAIVRATRPMLACTEFDIAPHNPPPPP